MAERRMFARGVVNSARFLRMPQTSRLLYYDLGMAADDDGVVEAFAVLRTTGAAEDDLRVLVSRGFVEVLNEDLVTYITDWKVNNQIRKDRYKPSLYADLLVKVLDGDQMAAVGLPNGSHVETQDRIGKVRQGQDRSGKIADCRHFAPPTVEEVAEYVLERGSAVDPQGFVDYYASKGWMVGKNPMQDWKAACRNAEKWERWGRSGRPAMGTGNRVKTAADYENGEDFLNGA